MNSTARIDCTSRDESSAAYCRPYAFPAFSPFNESAETDGNSDGGFIRVHLDSGSLAAKKRCATGIRSALFSPLSNHAGNSAARPQCPAAENPCTQGRYYPSVWHPELVAGLLGAVDRSSAKGKRDYAILLLACRLGLRAGDIRTLKLEDLHWDESTIKITQAKTDEPLSLPLTNEVGEALIDYLKSGRPQTTHREVFLKVRPPFSPFTENHLYHIVTYWRLLLGITFRSSQKRGIHSLRHTLANGSWKKARRLQRLRRSWGIPVWNQHVSTQKRI